MTNIKNILVAVDFNDTVGDLLNYAEGIAEKFEAKVWVLHVAEPDPDFVGYEPGPQYIREVKAEEFREEHRSLQMYCDSFLSDNIEKEALLIQGSTVQAVLEEVKKLNCDLLIIGTHKHGFFHKLFSESVSSKIFEKVNIPLLAIPIDEE